MATKAKTSVVSVGEYAGDFVDEGLIVLFGSGVPDVIADYCYEIDSHVLEDSICVGDRLSIGDRAYQVIEVGDCANENFENLGHLTLRFGEEGEVLDGAIRLRERLADLPSSGSLIVISN